MKEIIKGVTNSALSSIGFVATEKEKEANRRLKLCDGCKQKIEHSIKGFICNVCGCKLAWMARSDKQCEKGYWEENEVAKEDKIIKVK